MVKISKLSTKWVNSLNSLSEVFPSQVSILTVRKGEDLVGRGCWKKRMLCRNGVDRAIIIYEL